MSSVQPSKWNYKTNPIYSKGKKITRKSFYRKRASSSKLTTMVNKSSLRDHTIVADRFLTKLSASFTGTINTSASAAAQFTVYGNSLLQPFNTGNLCTGLLTAQQGSAVANEPMGFSTLSQLYLSYRVRSSRIKVTTCPTNTADIPQIVVFPVSEDDAVTAPYKTMNQRYARWKTCTTNNNVKENTIIHYMASHDVLGLTRQQYDDQPPTVCSSAPASVIDWYWEVAYTNLVGGTNSGAIAMTIEIDMYVEFSDPQPLSA